MIIDAWWFENRQKMEDILQADWFKPRSHFSVFFDFESCKNIFPVKLFVRAVQQDIIIDSKTYLLDGWNDSDDYEIVHTDNSILFTSFVDDVVGLPDTMQIEIKTPLKEYMKTVQLSYAEIKGKTTNFNGNPFPAAVVFMRKLYGGKTPSLGVWSDLNGEYSIRIPVGEYDSFYVDDNSYKVSSLENWSWNMIVDKDETYDFKIGNAEIYGLSAKIDKEILYLSFRPMVLPSIRYEESEIELDNEVYTLVNIQPDIALDDMIVMIDGNTVPIIDIERKYEKHYESGRNIALIAYEIKARLPDSIHNQFLVIVEYKTTGRYKCCSQGRIHCRLHK